jgi:F420-dependent oxidoreductase-like protein
LGPQVIEGFHGVPYTNPLGRTREIIDICRTTWRREAPLVHEGKNYTLPLPADQGTGLGKALKIIAHPVRSQIPVWVAALGERNVAMTAEVADGWIPILYIPEKANDVWGAPLAEGFAKRDAALGTMQITAGGLLAIGDGEDVLKLRDLQRSMIALYVGGMGAKGKNFYNELAQRYGYEKEAETIQELYLSGRKKEAEAAVPAEFCELTTLCGPAGYVAERIAAFKEAGVTHLQVHPMPQAGQSATSLIEQVKSLAS